MPLARQALHESGEDFHAAIWPAVHETHQLASRHYAIEGRCLHAELDLARIFEEAMTLDVTGHYHRPDCFRFETLPGSRAPSGEPTHARNGEIPDRAALHSQVKPFAAAEALVQQALE